MSDCEDTVFVECSNGITNGSEGSVEVLDQNSGDGEVPEVEGGEREDIVQASEAVERVKVAIQYHDDESLQEALDKVRERAHIDAEFQEKIRILQRIRHTENYSDFHDVVDEALKQLGDAQERAKAGKTSLSRPIEVLNEVLPVFEKACSVYTEKVKSSPKVHEILRELDNIRQELKECEQIDVGDVEKAKKLERKCERMLEEAVKHGMEDFQRVGGKIKEEEDAGILTFFENTRNETNERMDFLMGDFEQMKNNCADDIKLTEQTLHIEVESKEHALKKFEAKDQELEHEIGVDMEREAVLRRQLEEVQEHRRALEEDRELRRAVQDKADVVHRRAEEELERLLTNLSDLLAKVDTANVVLRQTRDVCSMLFSKAVESKNMQNQDLKNVLLITMKNKHTALLAQGVNCLNVQEREKGAVEMLKAKIKKKNTRLHEALRLHMEGESKKLSGKIKASTAELECCKKNLVKVNERLTGLKQDIAEVQADLDTAGTSYSTLDQAYTEFKKHNEGDDGFSMPSMP